ncbi:carbonic anhydrase [Mollisia scopiformis]|uniref:Carbonic anhydrase n=1 Tax=Mollisia scopiformis TaxID=149040 RepID=A0A132BEN0_MOLSC|nr:carbonic anhydrase [Mollisia scopiformis]KUJ10137.1 carbonic anhydrase [Mollisia scopiformis]
MASNTIASKLLEQNKDAAKTYQPMPLFSELSSLGLEVPHTLIITCADPRISPEKFLDLGPVGPVIIRNVCGHVAPALNDIVSLDSLVNFTDVIIVHHTDCGSLMMKNENVRNYIKKELPEAKDVDSMKFGGTIEIHQSVKDDLAILRASPLIKKDLREHSYGFILDIKTGEFITVDA